MKKWICGVLSFMLAMSLLTGCGSGSNTPVKGTDIDAAEQTEREQGDEQTKPELDEADDGESEAAGGESGTAVIESETAVSQPTEAYVIETSLEQVVTAVGERFAEELDYIVSEEELDPSSRVTNAILNKTTFTVHGADENWCDVTIRYPNAAAVLIEVADALPEDVTSDRIDQAYLEIAERIESDGVEMLEERFMLQITSEYGYYDLVWTDEAHNAVRGGLYLIGME